MLRIHRRAFALARSAVAGLILWLGISAAAALATAQTVALDAAGVDAALAERALGAADAPVTVYAYESFSCGHCAAFHAETFDAFKARYIDTGKVRYVFRDYPLNLQARLASQIARCADPRHFFALADLIFANQANWLEVENPLYELGRFGRLAGLSTARMEACVDNEALVQGIDAMKADGRDEFGVETTPTFVIGDTLYEGRQTIEQLAAAIDPLLAE